MDINSLRKSGLQSEADAMMKHISRQEGKAKSRKKFTTKKSFSPSTVGFGKGRCPRYWYYAFNGEEFDDRISGNSARVMENGIETHEKFQTLLQEIGMAAEDDIEVRIENDDPPIFGFIDAIVDWRDKKWVMEFKTSRTEKFKIRQSAKKAPTYHLVQILLYMYVLDIDQGVIVYQDNNNQQRTSIAVELTQYHRDYTEYMIEWMREVYKEVYGDTPKLPARAFSQNSYECKGCPVSKVCWSDDREVEVKLKRLKEIKN